MSLLSQDAISVPNPMNSVNEFFSKSNKDSVNSALFNAVKSKYTSNLTGNVGSMLYNVFSKKNTQRTSMSKQYSSYQLSVNTKFNEAPMCTMRIMRTFKLKLLHRQIQGINMEIYLDATKVQALQTA
jgi:hypothetical protein